MWLSVPAYPKSVVRRRKPCFPVCPFSGISIRGILIRYDKMSHYAIVMQCTKTNVFRNYFYSTTSVMDKQKIITEIQQIAKNNGGSPPGWKAFQKYTGITKSTWYPSIWIKWGDALIEAGYQPNKPSVSYKPSHLILSYIGLIRKIGKFPVEGELIRERKDNSTFPSHSAFHKS